VRSLGLGVLATMVAIPPGVVVALFLERTRTVCWRHVVLPLAVVPLLLPPAVLAYAVGRFFSGPSVAVGTAVIRLPGGQLFGAALVLASSYWPLVMLSTMAGLRQASRELEDFAMTHTGQWRTLWCVTLADVKGYVFVGGALVFLMSCADYGVPHLFGLTVYPTAMLSAAAISYGAVSSAPVALPFVVVVGIAAWYGRGVFRDKTAFTSSGQSYGSGQRLSRIWLGFFVIVVIGATVIWPMVSLASGSGGFRSFGTAAVALSQKAKGSFVAAWWSAGVGTLVALVTSLALKRNGRIRECVSWAGLCALAVPGWLLAGGLISLYNRSFPLGLVYSSIALPVLAYIARFFYVPWLLSTVALDRIDDALVEAGRLDGAGDWRLFWNLTLPVVAPALFAGWLIQFFLSAGEMAMSVLVERAGSPLLSKSLLNLMHYGRDKTLNASCFLMMLVVVAGCALLVMVFRLMDIGER